MRIILLIVGIASMAFAYIVFTQAKSAVHEIEALMGVLIAVTSLGLASILNELVQYKDRRD